jgi:solute carrier family 50 protein (sugar transporter)
MRIDLFVASNGDIVLGEFTPTPFEGKFHCVAHETAAHEITTEEEGSGRSGRSSNATTTTLDACVLGQFWDELLPPPITMSPLRCLQDWDRLSYAEQCARAMAVSNGTFQFDEEMNEDEMWCPPGHCRSQVQTESGRVGPKSLFTTCVPSSDDANGGAAAVSSREVVQEIWTGSLTDVVPPEGWLRPVSCDLNNVNRQRRVVERLQQEPPTNTVNNLVLSLLSLIATVASIGLGAAPLFEAVAAITKMGGTGKWSCVPLLAIWTNASLWCLYGLFSGDLFPMALTNGVNAALGAYYCLIYWRYSTADGRAAIGAYFGAAAMLVSAVAIYCVSGVDTLEKTTANVGTLGCAVCIAMFASPLATVKTVLRTRSSESMPFRLTVMGVICSTLWLLYGCAISDGNVIFPNGCGLGLGLSQLYLFWKFPSKEKKKIAVVW